jgi:hypothetical protein
MSACLLPNAHKTHTQNTHFVRVQVLATSIDLVHWQTCAVVLWDDTGLNVTESIMHTGLQYIDWRFDHTSTDTTTNGSNIGGGGDGGNTALRGGSDDSRSGSVDGAVAGAIVAAVRAGYKNSTTYHDANRLLITRVDGYAALCSGPLATGTG